MGMTPSRDNLSAAAKMMQVSPVRAKDIAAEVSDATINWRQYLLDGGVLELHLRQVERCYEFGQKILNGFLAP